MEREFSPKTVTFACERNFAWCRVLVSKQNSDNLVRCISHLSNGETHSLVLAINFGECVDCFFSKTVPGRLGRCVRGDLAGAAKLPRICKMNIKGVKLSCDLESWRRYWSAWWRAFLVT